jgi:methylenetetrahydrofolate reductase (NADPH)
MDVPEDLIDRMAGVPKEKAVEEGLKICLETIAELRDIEGVHGVHIMAIEWEDIVGEIVESAGLMPRP